ncbi:MAG: 50S ribosomal protein L18e [Candidatus Micrarchaeota archaeon]
MNEEKQKKKRKTEEKEKNRRYAKRKICAFWRNRIFGDIMSEKENKKSSAGVWREAQPLLGRPVRARKGVNLSKLAKSTKEGQTVLVASKVLGDGYINHKLTVAALGFSKRAKEQIEAAGGKTMSVAQLKAANPSGEGVELLTG